MAIKTNILPFVLVGAAIYYLVNSAKNIPKNIGVGITKVSSISFKNFPDLFIKYKMEIVNFNNFEIPISGLLGQVFYGNILVGQISFQDQFNIPSFGKKFIDIDIQASLLSLGIDIYSKIKDQSSFKGKLMIVGNIYSSGVALPFERILF